MVSNVSPMQTISYSEMPHASIGKKTYLPVDSRHLLYSHFKHVSGVPQKEGQPSISITKLNLLNTLIDQLITMKKNAVEIKDLNIQTVSEESLDSMIDYYSTQINTLVAQAHNLPYPPEMPQTAVVLNFTA